jgi:capsular exopolysaccharide synthesis family protein
MGSPREESVLGVEKPIALCLNDRHELSSAENDIRVQLRSSPAYPLIVDPEQRTATEHFGVLRARLLNARSKSDFRSVVITSPQKQDGKSFTSVNLAISLAQLQQMRILLVDGDLRLRGTTGVLGLDQSTGLADFLRHMCPLKKCIWATSLSHLHIAPAGKVAGESLPAILEGSKWREFIQEAKREFDLLIVDSVPVAAPIADFELLLNACDVALLVVHVRKTTRAAMDLAANRLHGKLLGIVVNNREQRADSDYYSPYSGKESK